MLQRLPERKRPVHTDLDTIAPEALPADDRGRADARALAREAGQLSRLASTVLKEALAALPLEDRMILRFRFASSMTVSDISRMMRLPQRPLYRRLESLLARLRSALAAASLDPRDLEELIGAEEGEAMDFCSVLPDVENDEVRQSLLDEEPQPAARESS